MPSLCAARPVPPATRPRALAALALVLGLTVAAQDARAQVKTVDGQPSAFRCRGLDTNADLPVLEGRDGVMFRINQDLRMNHSFSDHTVAEIAALSNVLAANGTRLIYVPIPTKGVSMPDYLPREADLFGFDLDVATAVHTDVLDRLRAAGVATVDVREAMLDATPERPAFFRADFHWTAEGARLSAQAVAALMKGLPEYFNAPKTNHVTVETGEAVAFSGMRRLLQSRCEDTLPLPTTMSYETSRETDPEAIGLDDLGLLITDDDETADAGLLDLFGAQEERIAVALVGTSFSDSPLTNFDGFLAQYSGMEVVNYAFTGGNQYGAITSYIPSREFAASRPHFLIWENPIYNNLAQFGDQPMRELIAAAGESCTTPMPFEVSRDGLSIDVDLSQGDFGAGHTLMLDADGSTAGRAEYLFSAHVEAAVPRKPFAVFSTPADAQPALAPDTTELREVTRAKIIARSDRMRRTGRFYMPLSGLWESGLHSVTITLSAPAGDAPVVLMCDPQGGFAAAPTN